MIEGYYYLHTNGDLIYKRDLDGTVADLRDSDFVVAFWPFDPESRGGAWRIVVEAEVAGANPDRIQHLARHWGCDDEDAAMYASTLGVQLEKVNGRWRATVTKAAGTYYGEGVTALEAFQRLASIIGYRPSKMWGKEFHRLCRDSLAPTVPTTPVPPPEAE